MYFPGTASKLFQKYHKRFIVVGGGAFGAAVYSTTNTEKGKTIEVTSSAIANARNTKPIPTRAKQIEKLGCGKEFDILVVGGGATGSGKEMVQWCNGAMVQFLSVSLFAWTSSSKI